MTGPLLHQYFYLPYEFRPEIDFSSLAVAKGGSPPWQVVPSYPSPPMSSPPSPQRKVSDIQPPPVTTYAELALSAPVTSSTSSSINSAFSIPAVPSILPSASQQTPSRASAFTTTAAASQVPRTYSSSSNESVLYRRGSASSASNVPDPLPTAGPSVGPASPDQGRAGRRTKTHVANACNNCKRAHLSCDVERPCGRCVATGKTVSFLDTCCCRS